MEGSTFSVASTEAPEGHVTVRVEDQGHDVPRGGEPGRGGIPAEVPEEVPLILRYAVVYFDVVVGTAGVVLQLKVVEAEQNRGALWDHDQPGAVQVVGIQAGEVWAGDVPRWSREDASTFHPLESQTFGFSSGRNRI